MTVTCELRTNGIRCRRKAVTLFSQRQGFGSHQVRTAFRTCARCEPIADTIVDQLAKLVVRNPWVAVRP